MTKLSEYLYPCGGGGVSDSDVRSLVLDVIAVSGGTNHGHFCSGGICVQTATKKLKKSSTRMN